MTTLEPTMQLIAIHQIERRQKGRVQTIAPGQSFSATDTEADALLASRAARKSGSVEKETPTVTVSATQGPDMGKPEAPADLESMTKAELVAYAEQNGVDLAPNATKADILATLAGDDEIV
jgi:hypothetical protein